MGHSATYTYHQQLECGYDATIMKAFVRDLDNCSLLLQYVLTSTHCLGSIEVLQQSKNVGLYFLRLTLGDIASLICEGAMLI